MHRVTVRCPAKVNLGLEVLGRRPDGYHDICSVLQAIDLYDELTVELADADPAAEIEVPALDISGPYAAEVPAEGNTLLSAWAVAGGPSLPQLRAALVKRIPSGAGLGGGSSDAAAMLLALAELRRLLDLSDTSPADLAAQALRIGSDVPFFLHGGCALAQGRGELLTPLARATPLHIALAVPQLASPTASAYAALNRPQAPMQPMVVPQLARDLERGDLAGAFAGGMVNDFAPPLLARHSQLRELVAALDHAGALAAGVTGSGSGIIGVFADEQACKRAAESLRGISELRYVGAHRAIDF